MKNALCVIVSMALIGWLISQASKGRPSGYRRGKQDGSRQGYHAGYQQAMKDGKGCCIWFAFLVGTVMFGWMAGCGTYAQVNELESTVSGQASDVPSTRPSVEEDAGVILKPAKEDRPGQYPSGFSEGEWIDIQRYATEQGAVREEAEAIRLAPALRITKEIFHQVGIVQPTPRQLFHATDALTGGGFAVQVPLEVERILNRSVLIAKQTGVPIATRAELESLD